MDLTQTPHQLARRPGTWGAGFLVRDANSPHGFAVHTFEHELDDDGRTIRRRRLRDVAAERGIVPCTLVRVAPDSPPSPRRAEFCFEVDPHSRIHPHLDRHLEWQGPDAPWVRTLLAGLGLLAAGTDN